MLGTQETPKKTCHKLIVTLNLAVRTRSICCCASLWYFHQAAEHLEHFPLEVSSLIRVHDEGHPKPYHISFKERSCHHICLSCLQRNHLKKSGELVYHHQDILMSSGSLTKWTQHIQMHPIIRVPSLIRLQRSLWVRFRRLLRLQASHVATWTLTSVGIPYQYTFCRILSTVLSRPICPPIRESWYINNISSFNFCGTINKSRVLDVSCHT